jgi:hypothetical protein
VKTALLGGVLLGAAAAAAAAAAEEPAWTRLGLAALPAAPSGAARSANAEGLRALKEGRLEQARARFDEAVRLAPDLELARYNLACSLARLGRIDEAGHIVEALAERDLPQFAPRFEHDVDLEALRRAPAGARVRARLLVLGGLWQQAAAQGVAAVLWRTAHGRGQSLLPELFRVGVYVHRSRRFLPLLPSEAGAASALVDLPRRQAIVIKLDVNECGADFCPRLHRAEVLIYRLFGDGVPFARYSYQNEQGIFDHLYVQTIADGALVKIHDCGLTGCESPWRRVTASGRTDDAAGLRPDEPLLEVGWRGSLLETTSPPASLRAGILRTSPGEAGVRLAPRPPSSGHSSLLLAQGGAAAALLLTTFDGCECTEKREGAIFRHEVARLALPSGHLERLAGRPGMAAARLAEQASVYLQQGETLLRWPSIDAVFRKPPETILPGVLLSAPLRPADCCGL